MPNDEALGAARQGHRSVPHTADLCIQAWASTREECLAEAVRGLVGSFADVTGIPSQRDAMRHLSAGSDEDLLVSVVEEVIYRLDADGEIPVSVAVSRTACGGIDLVLSLVAVDAVEVVGAAPKAATWHGLRCSPEAPGRWSCSVVIDV